MLRWFKYYELARLTVRDACADWVPLLESGVTLREISQLADALLDSALCRWRSTASRGSRSARRAGARVAGDRV